jgi:SPX domain protein involved in polyphosphate accumulation
LPQLAKEIQDTIQAKGLRPMLRTFARRTVFMVRDVPTLSCSIDNDVVC